MNDITHLTLPPDPSSDSNPDPAFHAGERALQERAGMREQLGAIGDRVMRDRMPDQHRGFFAQLPFVLVGSMDAQGRPWASVLANPPGFIHSPDPRHLVLRAQALQGDPLVRNLIVGAPIGLLGIEPQTRRRNRVNGVLVSVVGDEITVRVDQSFGNCPKYIQARRPEFVPPDAQVPAPVHRSTLLDAADRKLIASADTFYIATLHPDARSHATRAHGVDISHRGGKPGFVRIDDERTLTVPDFAGNFFFNTLGNIALYPKAGLLFMDFTDGDLLHVSADAEIIWSGPDVAAFEGAERLLRLHVNETIRVNRSLPLRWGEAQISPFLADTGDWGDPDRD